MQREPQRTPQATTGALASGQGSRSRAAGRRTAIAGCLYAVAEVAATTLIFSLLRRWLIPEQAFLFYLPMVIAIAVRYGFGPSVLASLLSFFAWDFFFVPPYDSLFASDPRNWLSLLVFLIAAVFTAQVASGAKRQAQEAEARARETEIIYQASEEINREVDPELVLQTLVDQIVRICGPTRCAVFEWRPETRSLALEASSPLEPDSAIFAGIAAVADAVQRDRQPIGFRPDTDQWTGELGALGLAAAAIPDTVRGIYIPLHVHGASLGVLHCGPRQDGVPFTPHQQRVIMTLSNHAAAVIARQAAGQIAGEQERQKAIAEERNRLAREVHDTLTHAFNGIKFLLEAAEHLGPSERGVECIAEARRLARQGAQEARRSVWALRPAALEQAGDLASAIWNLGKGIEGEDLAADVAISGAPYRLPHDVEENIYRIAQEALANIVRHAQATRARLSLAFAYGQIILTIEDNGRGMDLAQPSAGFGLESMRQRAEKIGGNIDVVSSPGNGTRVKLTVAQPFPPDAQHRHGGRH